MRLFVRIPGKKDSEAIFSSIVEKNKCVFYVFEYLDGSGMWFIDKIDCPAYQFFDQTGKTLTHQEAAKFLLKEYAKRLKQTKPYPPMTGPMTETASSVLSHKLPPVKEISLKTTCSHKWKKYVGFIEEYDYCEVCDEKRN